VPTAERRTTSVLMCASRQMCRGSSTSRWRNSDASMSPSTMRGSHSRSRCTSIRSSEWDDVLHTNLRGVFFALKYQIPVMMAGTGGVVVTSSSDAIATLAERGAYAASKHALVGLVQAAALEYGQNNIRINAMLPGTTDTALVRRVAGMENAPYAVWRAGAAECAKSHMPGLGRMANPEEIAEFALTLASDEHPFLTGAALVIDGGKGAQGG